jgi:lipopolysaccharide transport system ATP-binding protein
MSSKNLAISVRGLSKAYSIAHEREQHVTLAESLLHRIRNPRSAFGGSRETFYALKGISLDIKKGEVVGIIGANGAGKSTLLKILTRITVPTAGRVDLYGRVASLLEVGTGFHPELTGRENVFLNGAILGMTRTEVRRKFDEIVDFAGVEKFLDTPVKRFSSGMYVRLAFAVAAHLEPEILIVDEVLAVGDAEFQDKCLDRMRVVSGHGRTVLFVSHNMAAIRSLCRNVIVLERGEKIFSGPTEDGVAFYAGRAAATRSQSWSRPGGEAVPRVGFERIRVSLSGKQPALTLQCEMAIRCLERSEDVFVAMDICGDDQSPLMQSLPLPRPFLAMTPGLHELTIRIDLPPLIPGRYLADVWVGSHHTVTNDYIKSAVAFEISEGPVSGRSFPYSPDHGRMFPVSHLGVTNNQSSECPPRCPV